MGLDTTHGCWHGAYSAFNRFRRAVAASLGADWDVCHGRKYAGETGEINRWPEHWTTTRVRDALLDHYSIDENDPILVLLAHSDCDGTIGPFEAGLLADRLEELEDKIEWEAYHGSTVKGFIEGLRQARTDWVPVLFH